MTTLNRDAVPIGDDIEPVGESRVDVETRNEEEQEPEDCGYAVYRSWCAICVKGRCVGKHLQVGPLEEEERERTPMVAFDCVFLTQENVDTFPIPICRYNRHGGIPLLVYLIKYLDRLKITLEYENESSPKVLQEAMIHSCVEVVVREMKRQCRTLRISAERNTRVRITDDNSLLNWVHHFAMQFLNKIRPGRRWRKTMFQFGEETVKSFVKRIIQGICVCHHDRTRTISYITKSGIVRGKSRTRQTLSDVWESTIREDLFGNP